MRRLLGLEDVLSIGFCGPTHDERSWTFDLDPGGVDPVLKIPRLQDAYLARSRTTRRASRCPRSSTCRRVQVVTNDFAQMTLDLSTEWTALPPRRRPAAVPEALRDEIDEVAQRIYTEVNNGVYRCGFAGSQEAYDKAYDRLFTALDWLSDRLTDQRYLVGDTITEADVRLFTTLARFDPVYHGHFKCNRQKLAEMPVLWAYARDLFQTPGFGDTIDFVQIKQHYYIVHSDINPTQHRAEGAELSNWLTPHGREALGGRPFGDGTPPGPTPEGERVPAGHSAARARRFGSTIRRAAPGTRCRLDRRTRVSSCTARPVSRPRCGSTVGMVTASLVSGPEHRRRTSTDPRRPRRKPPWSAGDRRGHRQLHRIARVDGEFAVRSPGSRSR